MLTVSSLLGAAFSAYAQGSIGERIRISSGQLMLATLCAIVAAAAMVASIACVIGALWIFLLPRLGPVGAPLVIAGVLLTFAIILLAITRRLSRRRQAVVSAGPDPTLILGEATDLFRKHKGSMLLAALVAGLIVGNERRN